MTFCPCQLEPTFLLSLVPRQRMTEGHPLSSPLHQLVPPDCSETLIPIQASDCSAWTWFEPRKSAKPFRLRVDVADSRSLLREHDFSRQRSSVPAP